jgi:LmbE family N-acetylglucosaminyl deacetylase
MSSADNRLAGRVAILSPHLDDAVLSLGAAITKAVRTGATVRVVTVFSGDEASTVEASPWDSTAGFVTEGDAARARGKEDDRACSIVGAESIRLSFPDKRYADQRDGEAIMAAIREAVATFDILLIPGFPLRNEDHLWLSELVLRTDLSTMELVLYAEQPYAAWTKEAPRTLIGVERPWVALKTPPTDQFAKLRACRAYHSQIPLLGGTRTLLGTLAYEAGHGGESVSWIER